MKYLFHTLIYFSTTSDYTLRACPPLPEEYKSIAAGITSAFLGDPSFFAYNGEEPEPEDPEAPPVERFRECHRLTFTVEVNYFILFNKYNFI